MRFEKPEITNSPFAYNATELAVDVGINIFAARTKKGWTQLRLAEKMETLQPAIARVERGNTLPSLGFLLRIAKSLGTGLVAPTFESITVDQSFTAIEKLLAFTKQEGIAEGRRLAVEEIKSNSNCGQIGADELGTFAVVRTKVGWGKLLDQARKGTSAKDFNREDFRQ